MAAPKDGADDYLAQGHGLEDSSRAPVPRCAGPAPRPRPPSRSRRSRRSRSRTRSPPSGKWLYLPDPELLYVLWGAIAAKPLPGDPVWLVLVDAQRRRQDGGDPRLRGPAGVRAHRRADRGGLLSGTSAAERAEDATGGVLRIIGARGVIVAKDFTSVLAMEKDSRGACWPRCARSTTGRWLRQLGTDGGRELAWEGKAGFVAGVTHEIDRHYGVMARMGERLLL
jgi:hypothetical protein